MVYEYAVDPKLVVSWWKSQDNFRYFMDKFGLGQPRMMSEYPRLDKWRKAFKQEQAAIKEDFERIRSEELIKRLTENRISRNRDKNYEKKRLG